MEFRRIERFPPYVFSIVNDLKFQARRAGVDIIDLGMGNPDIPTPEAVVEKLKEAVDNPRNHRYSASKGIPKLRRAICDLYERAWDVTLDPDREAVATIGAKEGLSHLAWVLCEPGDSVLVPEPTYPIHTYAMLLSGATVTSVPLDLGSDFSDLVQAYEHSSPKPRVVLCSFPHNPTTAVVDLGFFEQLVEFAKARNVMVVHDLACADLVFDAERAPSMMQVPGARDVGVEFFSMSKSYSMAGWRLAFAVGNHEMIGALTKLKSYLDYGVFQPIQIAGIIALNECPEVPKQIREIYRAERRPVRRVAADRVGHADTACDDVRLGQDPAGVRVPRVSRLRQVPHQGGEGGRFPGGRFRSERGRLREVRARRERAADPPGDQGDQQGAAERTG